MHSTVADDQAEAESLDVNPPRVTGPALAETTLKYQRQWPRTFRALRHSNYRLFWTGQLISLTGTWMQSVAQGWLVYSLTKSDPVMGPALWLGIVSFAFSLPVMLFSLVGGVVADRVDRRRFLLLMQIASLVQALTLAVLAATGFIHVGHVVLLAFCLGAIHAFDTPARQAIIIQLVGREDLMNAVALNSSVFNSSRIIGPGIAGTLLGALTAWFHGGLGWAEAPATQLAVALCFFLNALSFVAPIVALSRIQLKRDTSEIKRESLWISLRAGLRYVRENTSIIAILSLVGISSIFGFSYITLLPLFAGEILQAGPQGYGLLMAGAGVGALGAALLLASLGNYQRKGLLLTVGNFLFPTALLLFAFSPIYGLSWVCLVVAGAGLITQNALANTLLQANAPDHLRGRTLSLYTLMLLGMQPIGGLQIGTMARLVGAQEALAISALICIAFALLVLGKWPQVRGLP
jgi:MFS family permease